MDILCDTCSILMLIRIAPNMFIDKGFECVTIPDARKELFQTNKERNNLCIGTTHSSLL